jgi:hypothetical protein
MLLTLTLPHDVGDCSVGNKCARGIRPLVAGKDGKPISNGSLSFTTSGPDCTHGHMAASMFTCLVWRTRAERPRACRLAGMPSPPLVECCNAQWVRPFTEHGVRLERARHGNDVALCLPGCNQIDR